MFTKLLCQVILYSLFVKSASNCFHNPISHDCNTTLVAVAFLATLVKNKINSSKTKTQGGSNNTNMIPTHYIACIQASQSMTRASPQPLMTLFQFAGNFLQQFFSKFSKYQTKDKDLLSVMTFGESESCDKIIWTQKPIETGALQALSAYSNFSPSAQFVNAIVAMRGAYDEAACPNAVIMLLCDETMAVSDYDIGMFDNMMSDVAQGVKLLTINVSVMNSMTLEVLGMFGFGGHHVAAQGPDAIIAHMVKEVILYRKTKMVSKFLNVKLGTAEEVKGEDSKQFPSLSDPSWSSYVTCATHVYDVTTNTWVCCRILYTKFKILVKWYNYGSTANRSIRKRWHEKCLLYD